MSDIFEGAVTAITVQRSTNIEYFDDPLSASNGSMKGPSKTFHMAFNADNESYYLILKGERIFHASTEEFDYHAPKHALENIKEQLKLELSLEPNEVDQLLFYITANIDDDADIFDANFTHIVIDLGEVDGADYFKNAEDASNRIWVSTATNLEYVDITIDHDAKTLSFDDETLYEKEVVSWSHFKLK